MIFANSCTPELAIIDRVADGPTRSSTSLTRSLS
jgi:hypothetical protein